METVEVKVRPVGNALGVILPGRVVKEGHLASGDTVMLNVFKKRKVDLNSIFGIAKGASSFERGHNDRQF